MGHREIDASKVGEHLWRCPSCGTGYGEAKPDGGDCYYCGEAWEAEDREERADVCGDEALEGDGDVGADLVSAEEGAEVADANSWQRVGGIGAVRGFDKKAGQGAWRVIGAAPLVNLEEALGWAPDGLVLEFGVAGGESINRLAVRGRKVYGFDWWKGLPHDWNKDDLKGQFACRIPLVLPNVRLVEGLFSDTLEPFLDAHRDPVGFVHIDSDLYASCIYVLHCLVDRFLKGSVIAFDDMDQGHYGELQAWERYLAETGQVWECRGKQKPEGRVYQCVDLGRH